VGLLEAANDYGLSDFKGCVVFHSLSKRSNLPGLRSGFVAGDAKILDKYRLYRTYHGCALPPPTQVASTVAWQDEEHVKENRQLYRAKFDAVLDILQPVMDVLKPQAGFYLWPHVPIDDKLFARRLYAEENLVVLPGSYISRVNEGVNPGAQRVRMALVAPFDECVEGAKRMASLMNRL
jgi:N-succinyldiaminopimelate aminotransferase